DYSANENSTKKQSSVNPVETHERSTKEPIDIDISRHQYGKTGSFHNTDIAVIGMSCHFPEARDLDQYWRLLSEGASSIKPIPQSRWGVDLSAYAALLQHANFFDYKFFGLSRREASVMDPQARLLLEESLRLFYHAGYEHNACRGHEIGVYLGARSQHQPSLSALKGIPN